MSPCSPRDELPEDRSIFAPISKMNCQYDEDIFLRPSPRFSKSGQTVVDFHLSWFPFGTAQLTIAPTIHNRQSHLPHHEFHQGQKRPPRMRDVCNDQPSVAMDVM